MIDEKGVIIPNIWTKETYKEFITDLTKLSDSNYLNFNKKLVFTKYKMLGIRVPLIRKLAKKISKTNIKSYLNSSSFSTYEEILLYGILISYLDSLDDFNYYLEKFLPMIDNWAICDMTVCGFKIISKSQKYFFKKIRKYLNSNEEFIVRVGLIMLMNFYLTDEYIDEIFNLIDNINSDKYYVNMAIAWLISELYIKHKEKTVKYLKNNKLDKFTHNKAISKIKDSYRVTKEEKDNLTALKK